MTSYKFVNSAQLTRDKVAKYAEFYDEYKKVKAKNLLESIKIADRIIAGESTYESKLSCNIL